MNTDINDSSYNQSQLPHSTPHQQTQSIQPTNPPSLVMPVLQKERQNLFFSSTDGECDMFVTKRNGKIEPVSFDKILKRIKAISRPNYLQNPVLTITSTIQNDPVVPVEGSLRIHFANLAMKVIDQLYNKISTNKIDELTAEQCASMLSIHPDYGVLASRVIISNHHRDTPSSFLKAVNLLYKYKNKHGKHAPLLSESFYQFVHKRGNIFDALCGDCRRDYLLDYFGFKTLEKSYLMRINGKIIERPQYMWLRVAIAIHLPTSPLPLSNSSTNTDIFNLTPEQESMILSKITETYEYMSNKFFTHATPTLFNAGTPTQQLSSCFLEAMESDSIEGIYNTLKDCALISKWAGGIGLHIHNVRATGSHINGTNGVSNGIIPMLKVFNNTARYVDQCFLPETLIYTTKGIMPMKHITVGTTEIFNDTGNYETVHDVLEHTVENVQMMDIETMHSLFSLKTTEEHPLCVLRKDKYHNSPYNPYHSIESLHKYFGQLDLSEQEKQTMINQIDTWEKDMIRQFEFVEANRVQKGDLIAYRIPKYEADIKSIALLDCYIYGILIQYNNPEHLFLSKYTNNIVFSHKKCSHLEKMLSLKIDVLEYFDINIIEYEIEYAILKNTNSLHEEIYSYEEFIREIKTANDNTSTILKYSINIKWKNNLHMPFRNNEFLYTNDKKSIHSRWLNLPNEKIQEILHGILCNCLVENKEYIIKHSSVLYIESIRYLCMRLGYLTRGFWNEIKHVWVLFVPKGVLSKVNEKKELPVSFFRIGDYLLTPITGFNTEYKYTGVLYDLQMKNTHNYMIHHGIVHNGGGKRNGSFAIYLEPWHADIELFLQMRKNHGDEELKARDLFYALWIPDLFMERVKTGKKWTLMCPDECPGLSDVYGEEFNELYTHYENNGKGRKSINARELWFQVLDSQMETGTPYLLYKDAANRKSNQKNVGIIKSSNLCVAPETFVLTDKGHERITSLVGKKNVMIWNGYEYSKVMVEKTGDNQPLIEVETNEGVILNCTPYHKFYIYNITKYSKDGFPMIDRNNIKKVDAIDLNVGDILIESTYPVIDSSSSYLSKQVNTYTQGFFAGSFLSLDNKSISIYECDDYGNANEQNQIIILENEKCELLRHLEYKHLLEKTDNSIKVQLHNWILEPNYIPNDNTPIYSKMKWFSGFFDANGVVLNNCIHLSLANFSLIYPSSLQNTSKQKYLVKLKLFLQTCGVHSIISKNNDDLITTDKNYNEIQNTISDLYISNDDGSIQRLIANGFSSKIAEMNDMISKIIQLKKHRSKSFTTYKRKLVKTEESDEIENALKNGFFTDDMMDEEEHGRRFSVSSSSSSSTDDLLNETISLETEPFYCKIKRVENKGRIDSTYCFTEPKRNMGVFNGILAGNCTEIMEYSDSNETAVCNLASIALPSFVEKGVFSYEKLHKITKIVAYNLNRVIDINYYPIEKTRRSNMRHRPIGIGVQGLADVFMLMNIPFHSEEAKKINVLIFETIYHSALETSCELAEKEGEYETFRGCPASEGLLQFDLWGKEPIPDRYDWKLLKENILKHGLRNSLLVAPMPTASTSQILGFNECFEPITSNIYSRRTLAGEFIVMNKYLMNDLIKLDMWNEKVKNNIIENNGSIQQLDMLPEQLRNKYKTVWEIPMRHLIDMSADRGIYICQSQSLNLWLEDPNYNILTSMYFYGWSKGLKTGIYYLRRRAKIQAQQFTIEPEKRILSGETEDICEMCSS